MAAEMSMCQSADPSGDWGVPRLSAGIGIAIGGTLVLLRWARFCTAIGAYAREMTVSCIAARHTEAIVLPPTHLHVLPCVFKGERRRGDATEHYVLSESAAKRRRSRMSGGRPRSLAFMMTMRPIDGPIERDRGPRLA